MNKLADKIAYIAGGTGNVGEGIVRAFLKEGATVITSSRKQEKSIGIWAVANKRPSNKMQT